MKINESNAGALTPNHIAHTTSPVTEKRTRKRRKVNERQVLYIMPPYVLQGGPFCDSLLREVDTSQLKPALSGDQYGTAFRFT